MGQDQTKTWGAALLCASLLVLVLAQAQDAADAADIDETQVEEMTVTGSFIRSGADSTSPLEIIDASQMEESVRPTLSDFLRVDVTQNIAQDTGITNSGFQGLLQGNRNASVNLRGLGKENNLVLLDSDRMVHYAVPDDNGWRSADVNATIPRILIKQTELLLDGGSALYGTDAIAGVVNLIPEYDLRGFKLSYSGQHFEQAPELGDLTFAAAAGFGNEQTSFIIGGEMQRTEAVTNWMMDANMPDLSGAEANFVYDTYGVREFNGQPGVPQLGEAVLSDPLCGQNDLFGIYPIEAGLTNGTSGDGFDGYETCSLARGLELFNYKIATDSEVVFAGLEHEFSDRLSGKFNASYGSTRIHNTYWGNQTFTEWRSMNYADALIPVNYDVNGTTVTHPAITYYDQLDPAAGWTSVTDGWAPGPVTQIINFNEDTEGGHKSEQSRIAGQLTYQLTDDWDLRFNTVYGASEVNATRRAVIAEHAIQGLLGLGGPNCDIATGTPGVGGCEWFNPFMSSGLPDAQALGLRNSRELLDFILPNDNRKFTAEMWSTQLIASGQLSNFELPGGPIGVAVGYEYRWEQEGVDFDDFLNGNGVVYGVGGQTYDDQSGASMIDYEESDEIQALLMELQLPVLDNLMVQVAGRYESYAGRNETFNPKIGFNWGPTEDIIIRGSVGTSYKAPSIAQTKSAVVDQSSFLNLGSPASPYYLPGYASPSAITTQLNKVTAPNPNLQAQESFNWSLGFDWDISDNMRFNATYTSIDFENIVETPNATEVLRYPQCNAGIVDSGVLRGFGLDGIRDPIVNNDYTGDDVNGEIGFIALGEGGNPVPIVIPAADPSCLEVDPLNGRPTRVFANPNNLEFRRIEGADFKFSWSHETDFGTFAVRPSGTILLKWEEKLHPNLPVVDQVGQRTNLGYGYSKYRVNVPMSWTRDAHTVTLTGRYISGLSRTSEFNGVVTEYAPFNDFYTGDLNWQWRINDTVRTSFYINNITDGQPPSQASIYPRLGRVFGMQISANFGGD